MNWKEINWVEHVGKGWASIVQPLVEYALKHDLRIDQVKEKFGGLRFYSQTDETLDKMVTEAETKSAETCEECGQPGKIRGQFWLSCRCLKHVI